jgi:hypothetical protein
MIGGFVFLGAAIAVAVADDALLPERLTLTPGTKSKVQLEISLASSFRSKDHRIHELTDEGTIAGSLDVVLGERKGELAAAAATWSSLAVSRHFHARVDGIFSESVRDGRGATAWHAGEPAPPPGFTALLTPRGFAVLDVSPVTSWPARWNGEDWLEPRDRDSHDDAKIRRMARYTKLGTLLGAPPLPPRGERRFEASFPLELGESGLTNAFVDVEVAFALEQEPAGGGFVRVHGPVSGVKLVRGREHERRVDQWIDVAFARGGPEATGELEAVFDPARGRFREVRSRIALAHEGAFEGGKGRATFERRLVAREE